MRLTTKVLSNLLAVLIILISIAGYGLIYNERQVLRQMMTELGKATSHTIAVFCIETLLAEDYPVLNTFLETTGRERDDILLIEVIQDGHVVSRYRAAHFDNQHRLDFSSDVLFSLDKNEPAKKLGQVHLVLSDQRNIDFIKKRIREILFFILITFFSLFTTMALVLRKTLFQRIKEISHHAKMIGAGDYNQIQLSSSNDELDMMSRTLNEMARNISESQQKISEKNKRLFNEINTRRQIERALAEEKTRLRGVIDSIPDPIYFKNKDHVYVGCNKAFEEYSGFKEEQLLGLNDYEVFDQDIADFLKEDEDIILARSVAMRSEEWVTYPDGRRVLHDTIKNPYYSSTGELLGIIGVSRDFTLRVVMQNQLGQAHEKLRKINETLELEVEKRTEELNQAYSELALKEKMATIGQMAAGVAHELNNPINFVWTNFHTLADNFKDISKLLEQYKKIADTAQDQNLLLPLISAVKKLEKEIDIDFLQEDIPVLIDESENGFYRIAKIIQSMRNFSRTDPGHEHRLANINQGIEDTLIIAKNEYKYHADIHKELGDIPEIYCSLEELNQVFLNLIVNSAQAISAQQRQTKGLISIRTWQEDESVLCEFRDDGPGIPEEYRERLFEPFFTTKPPGQGTGLGLSISYDIIVQKHHGELTVHCPEEGGTIFTIRLPINPEEKEEQQ